MLAVLTIIAPIFLLIGIGFFITKIKLIDSTHTPTLGIIVLYLAMPSIILNTFLQTSIKEVLLLNFALVYSLGTIATFALAFIFNSFALNKNTSLSALNSFGSAMPNTGFIGYPLLIQTIAEPPLAAFALLLIIEGIVIIPIGLFMLELGSTKKRGKSLTAITGVILKELIKNPLIISIILGVVISVFNLSLPDALESTILSLSKAAVPVGLIFIGATLASNKWVVNVIDITTVASAKLLIHPLMILSMMMIFPIENDDHRMALILCASAPMLTMYPVLADKYNYRPQAASLLLLTTLISFFSISLIFWVFPYLPIN